SAGVSAADLYYITTPPNRCQQRFYWFLVAICVFLFCLFFRFVTEAGISFYHVYLSESTGSLRLFVCFPVLFATGILS
ncbi:MAG TPA: hypothetical protein VEB00_14175, partial [Clostridia bacterium]|nr:hypothetical protein [Clostridia bacterium]